MGPIHPGGHSSKFFQMFSPRLFLVGIEMCEVTISAWIKIPGITCYDFLHIFAEKFGEKIGILTQNKAKLCKNFNITLVFEKNANFFANNCRKSLA
jgi:hypothetical protein